MSSSPLLSSLIVVSNRLPFVLKRNEDDTLVRKSSAGGLVTAVAPVVVQSKGIRVCSCSFKWYWNPFNRVDGFIENKSLSKVTSSTIIFEIHSRQFYWGRKKTYKIRSTTSFCRLIRPIVVNDQLIKQNRKLKMDVGKYLNYKNLFCVSKSCFGMLTIRRNRG